VQPAAGALTVEVEAAWRQPPGELHVHLRAPEGVTLHNVTVDGQPAAYAHETVRITNPAGHITVRAEY